MTKLLFSTYALFFLISISSCQTDPGKSTESTPKTSVKSVSSEEAKGIELLDQCIAAHGGIDNWNKFAGLSYDLESGGKSIYQLTQLQDRRTYTKSENFEIGSDGKTVWAKPNAEKVPGKSAAFYYNLDFYFVAIPFVLKDPGVNVSYLGKASPDGSEYDLLKISYGSEVGLSPEDLYFLYLDPTNHQLKILTYTVSYFDKTNEKVNSGKKYLDYKNVQGILMPTKMVNHRWKDGKLGENSNRDRLITNLKFHKTIPDEKVFEVPEGAVTEAL